MKKILIMTSLILSVLFLSACDSEQKQKTRFYGGELQKMSKLSELIKFQARYPEQQEFSLKYNSDLKRVYYKDGIKVEDHDRNSSNIDENYDYKYLTPLGELDSKIEKDKNNNYLTLNFQNTSPQKDVEYKKALCVAFLEKERGMGKLFGYNLNDSSMVERVGDINKSSWITLVCENYYKSPESKLFIGLRIN